MFHPVQIISKPNAIKPIEKSKLEETNQGKLFPCKSIFLRISKSVFIDFKYK